MLFIMPLYPKSTVRGAQFDFFGEFVFWCFISRFVILRYAGAGEVGYPYDTAGVYATIVYFSFFVIYPLCGFLWDRVMAVVIDKEEKLKRMGPIKRYITLDDK